MNMEIKLWNDLKMAVEAEDRSYIASESKYLKQFRKQSMIREGQGAIRCSEKTYDSYTEIKYPGGRPFDVLCSILGTVLNRNSML